MQHLDDLYKKIHGETAYLRMKIDSENIARIRKLCREYNLSLGELAHTIDEDPSTLEAINASEKPLTNSVLRKIAGAYGADFSR